MRRGPGGQTLLLNLVWTLAGLSGCDEPKRVVEAERPPCRMALHDAQTGELIDEVLTFIEGDQVVRIERPARSIRLQWPPSGEPHQPLPTRWARDEGRDGLLDEIKTYEITSRSHPEGGYTFQEHQQRKLRMGGELRPVSRQLFEVRCDVICEAEGSPHLLTVKASETDGRPPSDGRPGLPVDGQPDETSHWADGRLIRTWRDAETRLVLATTREEPGVLPAGAWFLVDSKDGVRRDGRVVEGMDGQPEHQVWARLLQGRRRTDEVIEAPKPFRRIDRDGDGQPETEVRLVRQIPGEVREYVWVELTSPEAVIARWSLLLDDEGRVQGFEMDGDPEQRADGVIDLVGRCEPGPDEPSDRWLTHLQWPAEAAEVRWQITEGERTLDGLAQPPDWVVAQHLEGQVWVGQLDQPPFRFAGQPRVAFDCGQLLNGGIPAAEVIQTADGALDVVCTMTPPSELDPVQRRWVGTWRVQGHTPGALSWSCRNSSESIDEGSLSVHRCQVDRDQDGVYDVQFEERHLRRADQWDVNIEISAVASGEVLWRWGYELESAGWRRAVQARLIDVSHVVLSDEMTGDFARDLTEPSIPWRWADVDPEQPTGPARPGVMTWDWSCFDEG